MTAAVPYPSFRDKLAEAIATSPAPDWGYYDRDRARRLVENRLLPLIAAEVQAQVQAAANQHAAEVARARALAAYCAWSEGYAACRRGDQNHNPYRTATQVTAPRSGAGDEDTHTGGTG